MGSLETSGITFAVESIGGGGAERVTATLANYWASHGRDVALITFTTSKDCDCYPLDMRVKRIHLCEIELTDFKRSKWGEQEEYIEKLKVALQLAGNKKVVAIMAKMSIRCLLANDSDLYDVYACERAYMPYTLYIDIDRYLRKVLYPRAEYIVIQSENGSREWLEQNVPDCRIAVIPNCLTAEVLDKIKNCKKVESLSQKYILNCARLVEQKQQDKLLCAYARIVSSDPDFDFRLKIVGTGVLENELKSLARDLDIEDRVDFLGWRDDVYSLMKGAHVFAFTSAFEGFPNAVLESMACGVPVVAFDCISGPSDIIIDNNNGLLIELNNVEKFSQGLRKICEDERFHDYLAENTAAVKYRFSEDRVLALWEKMLFND